MCICVCMRLCICTHSCACMGGNACWDYYLSLCWSHPCRGIQQGHKEVAQKNYEWLLAHFVLYCHFLLNRRPLLTRVNWKKKKKWWFAMLLCVADLLVDYLNKPGYCAKEVTWVYVYAWNVDLSHTNKAIIKFDEIIAVRKLSNYMAMQTNCMGIMTVYINQVVGMFVF